MGWGVTVYTSGMCWFLLSLQACRMSSPSGGRQWDLGLGDHHTVCPPSPLLARPLAAARWYAPSPRRPLGLEVRPRQALSVRARQVALIYHDGGAFLPQLLEVFRHLQILGALIRCLRPLPNGQHPRHPRLVHVLIPPVHLWRQHRHALAPQRRLAGELAPLLLPSGIGVQGEDQLAYLAYPLPAPAVDAEDRHHTRHARGQQ